MKESEKMNGKMADGREMREGELGEEGERGLG